MVHPTSLMGTGRCSPRIRNISYKMADPVELRKFSRQPFGPGGDGPNLAKKCAIIAMFPLKCWNVEGQDR